MPASMRGQHYRLNSDISAISTTASGQPEIVTIPANATLTVVQGPLNGTRFVDVVWDSATARCSHRDLEAHAERVEP